MILKTSGSYLFLTSQLLDPDISFTFLPCTITSESEKEIRREAVAPSGLLSCSISILENKFEIKILASSDDLFLCCESPSHYWNSYFICNPFTKEWSELPRPPGSRYLDANCVFGFTHKPYYHRVEEGSEQQQRVVVNSSCRFRVVRLRCIYDIYDTQRPYPDWTRSASEFSASEFVVDIFSSETWQWTTSMMQHSSPPNKPCSSISRNGFLYWLCYHGQVIIHDAYNNKVRYVAAAPQDGFSHYNFCVSQGSLLAYQQTNNGLSVWELEGEDCDGHQQPKWRFARSVKFESGITILVHPIDRNVIYVWLSSGRILPRTGGIYTLSLRTGKFKRSFFQELVAKVNCKSYEVRRSEITFNKIIVLKAPCWHTPISALLKSRRLEDSKSAHTESESVFLQEASSKLKNELKRLQWNVNYQ